MPPEIEEAKVESAATPEQQQEAEKMGWIPPSRYKGTVERFIDADAYLERGETILPIVKEQNRRLHTEVSGLQAANARLEQAVKDSQAAIEQIEERHTVETQKAVEAARRQVKEQLRAASEAGDHVGVAELTDQLTQLNAAEDDAPPVKKKEEAPPPFVPPADLVAWQVDNPWYGRDRRRTSLALGIAQELREAGETSIGRVFYDKVADEVEKTLRPKEAPRGDKVEPNRNNGEGGGGAKKGYSSMPSDAKAACDADGRRFVGEGKKYKDMSAWRARYAEIYYEKE